MIYIPNQLMRWVTYDEKQPLGETRYKRGLGWFSHMPVQATVQELVETHHNGFMSAFQVGIPMENQVYEPLGYRDLSLAELKFFVHDSCFSYRVKPNCTVQTALNRLMRQGKVTRVLHSRGWFRWYVYSRVE